MITLHDDRLMFSATEVHPSAHLAIEFQRTLRIPDDGSDYPLPPGLGRFPLRHADDYSDRVPAAWMARGGVMLPMYQAEAMWIRFSPEYDIEREIEYPFAIKIATGKINAVSGTAWRKGIHRKPAQDYVVAPGQPWLDGYCVEKGIIRQFVAMPLGAGYSVEEQVTGKGDYGGVQIEVFPMKRSVYERRFPMIPPQHRRKRWDCYRVCEPTKAYSMGLAPGGRMKQDIYEDDFLLSDWDRQGKSRCFVHIANSMVWSEITGSTPPTVPPTSTEYTRAGLPWFDWYDDRKPVAGSRTLAKLKSVASMAETKNQIALPENASVPPGRVVALRAGSVRELPLVLASITKQAIITNQ